MFPTRDDCCGTPDAIRVNFCTVPKGINHAEHENWTHWGAWSGDPDVGGSFPTAKKRSVWPNINYRPPMQPKHMKPTAITAEWMDDYDLLPDA